jgi:hydroxypyruvate reductase
VPSAVRAVLEAGAAGRIEETPKPGDPRLANSRWRVIGNRRTAMAGAEREAARRGYAVRVLDRPIRGEARDAGRSFVEDAVAASAGHARACVIASGETTVTVTGGGRGGRNQEFVLAAARPLAVAGLFGAVASAGTDGIDGPTDAAGGIATSSSVSRAATLGIDLDAHLARNDGYAALSRLGDLIIWGPTLTNVGDVQVVLTMSP